MNAVFQIPSEICRGQKVVPDLRVRGPGPQNVVGANHASPTARRLCQSRLGGFMQQKSIISIVLEFHLATAPSARLLSHASGGPP